MLIDSHCHLDRFHQKGQLPDLLDRAKSAGVNRLITIGTSSRDWSLYRELAKQYPDRVYWTAGLHPCDVDADWENELAQLPAFCRRDPGWVGIGEIGLDHFHLPKDSAAADAIKSRQRQAFAAQLQVAQRLDCPVVIHSRHAYADCLAMIDESGVDWRRVVFHCFSEGSAAMHQLLARGGRASFSGILTYKNAGNIREACVAQGVHRLMLETDSPFLTPEPERGKPNEPAFVRHTAAYAALLLGLSLEELAAQATANTVEFFGLSPLDI